MSTLNMCKYANYVEGVNPYIRYYGDEYFQKGWFSYKPIEGPDGTMSSGSMVHSPNTKFKRGEIFTRRGSDYIPGWGTLAGNLTMTNNFEQDLELIMNQEEIEGVFWVDASSNEVKATWFKDDNENKVH